MHTAPTVHDVNLNCIEMTIYHPSHKNANLPITPHFHTVIIIMQSKETKVSKLAKYFAACRIIPVSFILLS